MLVGKDMKQCKGWIFMNKHTEINLATGQVRKT